MNIAFFLTPKTEVIYLLLNSSMAQALEKMGKHRFTALPILDDDGKYAGTLTEGDLLWKMKETPGLTFADTQKVPLAEVPRQVVHTTVKIDANIEDLLHLLKDQNFVPVLDDKENFIGIVRRSHIIEFFTQARNGPTESPH